MGCRLLAEFAGSGMGEQRQIGRGNQAAGIPQGLTARQLERGKGIGGGKAFDHCGGQPCPLLELAHIAKRDICPGRHNSRGGSLGEPIDLS